MGKCREALGEEGGDLEKAVDWLRRRGVRSMERRTAEAAEALLALRVADDASAGAVVEVRAETDFVTRSELFQQLCICLAAAAAERLPGGGGAAELLGLPLGDGPGAGRPKQLSPGVTVGSALLELGSILGERLVLADAWRVAAPGRGIVAGYVHPKQADGLPNTGRMAALVALRALPPTGAGEALGRLRPIAAQLARHVVAAQPRFVSIPSVPAVVLLRERATFRAAHLEQLGPRKAGTIDENVMSKVLDGKTQKFYSDTVLLCQELLAPQAAAAEAAKGEARPVPVAEWLEAEARALGVEKIAVEDFRLAML